MTGFQIGIGVETPVIHAVSSPGNGACGWVLASMDLEVRV